MSIDRHVMAVRARLASHALTSSDVTEELRAHLEDAACDLQLSGLSPAESEREAVRRFGAPEEIANAFVEAREMERRGCRARGLRVSAAALLIAATVAALGSNAVASAHTPPGLVGSHQRPVTARQMHAHRSMPTAPPTAPRGR